MSASTPLPESIAALLPGDHRRMPAVRLDDGRWVVAGEYAIIVAAEAGARSDGSPAEVIDSGMWYEVATVAWNGESRRLTCTWVDPARTPLTGVTDSQDPADFMRVVTERVNRTMVTTKQLTTASGTTLTCWIRRREDDALISVLVADGPLDDAGEAAAARFEAQVREGVGLD